MVVPSHSCLHQHLGIFFAQATELLEAGMSLRSLGPVLMNFKPLSLGYGVKRRLDVPTYGTAGTKCRTVRCAQLVGSKHILVHSISLQTPFWAQDMGLLTAKIEKSWGIKQAPESRPWATE